MKQLWMCAVPLFLAACSANAPQDQATEPLPVPASLNEPQALSGTASVIDGDTIDIHGQHIRLDGVDAPERGKRCGEINVYQRAALALSDFIGTSTVSCVPDGRSGKRITARCTSKDKDLGLFLAEAGWARDWPRYSGGDYASAEAAARRDGRGLWGLDCPADLWGTRTYD